MSKLPQIEFKLAPRGRGSAHFYWYTRDDPNTRTSIGMVGIVTHDDLVRLQAKLTKFLFHDECLHDPEMERETEMAWEQHGDGVDE